MLMLPELISAKPACLIYHSSLLFANERETEIPEESQKGNAGWVNVSTEWFVVQRWCFAMAVEFVHMNLARRSLGHLAGQLIAAAVCCAWISLMSWIVSL